MIEATFGNNRNAIMKLPNLKTERIGLTHGLLMSYLQALCEILPITDNVKAKASNYINELAMEREQDLISDHPAMDQFWDVYEYFESLTNNNELVANQYKLNHSANEDEIAINLNEFYASARENNQSLEDIKLIKKMVQKSVRYPFIEAKSIRSNVNKKTLRCYVFKKK